MYVMKGFSFLVGGERREAGYSIVYILNNFLVTFMCVCFFFVLVVDVDVDGLVPFWLCFIAFIFVYYEHALPWGSCI
jgi:hypothetical protein